MDSREFIFDEHIEQALKIWGWERSVDEGRLMLVELMCKVNAGYYISHTENGFLSNFGFLRKDRTLSKLGRVFLCDMVTNDSNKQSLFCELSNKYRVKG